MNTIARLIYDTHKGDIPQKYSAMNKEARENAIRQEILDVLGLEKFSKKEFRQAFRSKKAEVFSIIEDLADQVMADGEYKRNAFYDQFVEVKNLALGDKNEFYVEGKNTLQISEFSGSHFNLKRRRIDVGQKFSLEMRDFGISIYEELERIMSGRADFAKLVALVVDAVERHLAELAQATFASAITNLPTEFVFNAQYNQDKIVELLTHVSSANNGVKPVLVGTATALAKLQGKSTIVVSSDMANEINAKGYLDVWQGYSCMELEQGHKVGSFEFTMPTNKVYALINGSKLVKVCLEGETMVKEVSDKNNADLTEQYTIAYKAGAAVAYSNLIGEITLV